MVEEGVVELEGLICGDFINEVRSPIDDTDDELSQIVADSAIVDLELYLVVSDVRKLSGLDCDCVTLRDSLGHEIGWCYKV